jgi:hypothetical protein
MMTIKQLLINLGKLIVGGAAFAVGVVLGGMLAVMLGLPRPALPEGADMSAVQTYMMLTTPLVALALAVLAVGLGGNWLTRTLILAFLTWIAYTLNTQLEASIVSTYAQGIGFALVTYAVPALLCGGTVAFLFRPENKGGSLFAAVREYFARHKPLAWAWRLALAAVAFMPIYFVFGLMVVPFTADYYRQSMFGLKMPTIEQILPILFVRSVLFLLASLPIFMLWQKSDLNLFWRLGLALFLLVGFIFMLTSTWLPLYVRAPHTLEILADEFVYAGVLVLLLGKGELVPHKAPGMTPSKLTP